MHCRERTDQRNVTTLAGKPPLAPLLPRKPSRVGLPDITMMVEGVNKTLRVFLQKKREREERVREALRLITAENKEMEKEDKLAHSLREAGETPSQEASDDHKKSSVIKVGHLPFGSLVDQEEREDDVSVGLTMSSRSLTRYCGYCATAAIRPYVRPSINFNPCLRWVVTCCGCSSSSAQVDADLGILSYFTSAPVSLPMLALAYNMKVRQL